MCRAFEEVREQALQEGELNEKLNSVKNLMDTLSLSLEEAIAALKVTDSEKEYVLENLDK